MLPLSHISELNENQWKFAKRYAFEVETNEFVYLKSITQTSTHHSTNYRNKSLIAEIVVGNFN